ncbi:MAG: hypothetical protein ACRDJU_00885 [Actinomycetota bacterium]
MSDSPEKPSSRIDELKRITIKLEKTEEELRRQLGPDADRLIDLEAEPEADLLIDPEPEPATRR